MDKEKLKSLSYDTAMLEALKNVFKKILHTDNILNEIDKDSTDELVGQKAKAIKIASEIVNDFFKEIESYKEVERLPKEEIKVK